MRLKGFGMPIRIGATVALLVCAVVVVGYIFWHQELKYSLPTPKPGGYHSIDSGASILLSGNLQFNNGKPALIHFYNPNCPCSKFNLQHVNQLIKDYSNDYNFVVVICHKGDATAADLAANFEPGIQLSFDTTIMGKCGVYSTPQAVVLSADGKLVYRGNYNKSRYCTTPESNYAQIAMQNLLDKKSTTFDKAATTAYGCQTEYCYKN